MGRFDFEGGNDRGSSSISSVTSACNPTEAVGGSAGAGTSSARRSGTRSSVQGCRTAAPATPCRLSEDPGDSVFCFFSHGFPSPPCYSKTRYKPNGIHKATPVAAIVQISLPTYPCVIHRSSRYQKKQAATANAKVRTASIKPRGIATITANRPGNGPHERGQDPQRRQQLKCRSPNPESDARRQHGRHESTQQARRHAIEQCRACTPQ